MAYHRDDSDWVRNELNKNLGVPDNDSEENIPTKFKFCIHERDFLPGNTIEDNIVNAIENSRKTILVLSGNFLTSGWCEFELQMARMESVKKTNKYFNCGDVGTAVCSKHVTKFAAFDSEKHLH